MKRLIGVFTILVSVSSISNIKAQAWSGVDSGIVINNGAAYGNVFAMQTYNGNLFVGGRTLSAGNIPARGIAQWNDSFWDSVNTGIKNDYVYALANYNGDLYAAGWFFQAGNFLTRNIAEWNGTVWDTAGPGIGGTVYALAVYNGKLYVGGNFTGTGGRNWISTRNIATWDGTKWDSVGTGIPGNRNEVNAMTVYNGKLYVGGYFTNAGGITAHNIASWDGTKWDSVGGGITGGISALAVYDSTIYAGGGGDSIGGKPIGILERWNGVKWDSVDARAKTNTWGPRINALYVFNNNLYAGGDFDSISNIAASSIAYWNGTNWHSLDQGVTYYKKAGDVRALYAYDGLLYAAGTFDTAGSAIALNIARCTAPLGITHVTSNTNSISVYPNPSTGIFNIALSHPELVSGSQTIAVYNVLGQSVYNGMLKQVQHDYEINLSSQPTGVYLYRVLAEDGSLLGEGKLIIQK